MNWLLRLFGIEEPQAKSNSSTPGAKSRELATQADQFIREKLAEGYQLRETLSVVYAGELAKLVTYYKLGPQGRDKEDNVRLILEAAEDGRIDYYDKRKGSG